MSLGLTSVVYASLCCLFLLFWFCFTFIFEIVLLFTADITFSGKSLPSDVPNRHRNKVKLRQLFLRYQYENVNINQVVECMSHLILVVLMRL